ncbi:MAG: aminopeptidase [Bacillota bacterium]
MINVELTPKIKELVEEVVQVKESDEVLVLVDPKKFNLGVAFTTICKGIAPNTNLFIMPLAEAHGNEPSNLVAASMKAADVLFTITTYAITHTRARLAAHKAGTKSIILRGVTEEMFLEGALTVDFKELSKITSAMVDIMTKGSEVRVLSDNGTDVTFSIEGREAFPLDGFFHKNYGFATLPPGESPTSPVEGTAEGTIVFDTAMDNIGHLTDDIVMEVHKGHVTKISGGKEAEELRRIVENSDENATNIAEFAIGTNPNAKIVGNLAEDKKKSGTVHFAIGDNCSLGGNVESNIHLDGLMLKPTVIIDGREVVKNGVLTI